MGFVNFLESPTKVQKQFFGFENHEQKIKGLRVSYFYLMVQG
jgi:hypothetical protein